MEIPRNTSAESAMDACLGLLNFPAIHCAHNHGVCEGSIVHCDMKTGASIDIRSSTFAGRSRELCCGRSSSLARLICQDPGQRRGKWCLCWRLSCFTDIYGNTEHNVWPYRAECLVLKYWVLKQWSRQRTLFYSRAVYRGAKPVSQNQGSLYSFSNAVHCRIRRRLFTCEIAAKSPPPSSSGHAESVSLLKCSSVSELSSSRSRFSLFLPCLFWMCLLRLSILLKGPPSSPSALLQPGSG